MRYDADFTADMPGVGYRSIDSIQSICVHTVECPPERDGIAVAQWQTNPANGSSYNVLAGADGILILCNTDDFMPYAAGPPVRPLPPHQPHRLRANEPRRLA